MKLADPLTPAQHRMIRLNIALMPVYAWLAVVWTTYAIDISPAGRLDRSGHIKGHDFAHFYVLGQIANEHAAEDLYSFESQARRMDRLVPEYENRFEPIYGPQMSVFFAPLARLKYEHAVAVWLIFTAAGYGLCCFLLWTKLHSPRQYAWLVPLLAAAYPPFYQLMAFGQNTVLGLGCVTAGYFALRANRPFLAGLALGSMVYKPVFGFAMPFVLIYGREWRMICGAATAVALQLGVGAACYGAGILPDYFDAVTGVGKIAHVLEPIPFQMQSLRSFFSVLVPSSDAAFVSYLLAAAVVVALAARCWRTSAALELRFSVLLLATVLVNPHVNPYDLVVILPVFMLVTQWALARGGTGARLWVPMYLSYFLPSVSFLPEVTHVQFSVIAVVTLMAVLTMAARTDAGGRPLGTAA